MLGSVCRFLTARVLTLVIGLAGLGLRHVAASHPVPSMGREGAHAFPALVHRRRVPRLSCAVPFPQSSSVKCICRLRPFAYARPAATTYVHASLRRCFTCSLLPPCPVAVFRRTRTPAACVPVSRLLRCLHVFSGPLLIGSSLALLPTRSALGRRDVGLLCSDF